MIILGLETSCDDTAAAVLKDGETLSSVVHTQLEHENYGGVVPELASRAHLRNLIPVIESALNTAGVKKDDIDALGVTAGPGLIGALLVGVNFARGWGDSGDIKLIGVNHLQAHIWAAQVEYPALSPPFISLLVSGGHTSLALVKDYHLYEQLGTTLDDAAGEVLDKIGRLLGLGYPCGAELEKLAGDGDPKAVHLPRGMIHSGDLNFSFSGLKTAAKLFLDKNPQYLESGAKADFCASLQESVMEILARKTSAALEKTGMKKVILGGGVAANKRLRELLQDYCDAEVIAPSPALCTDNGIMTANLAYRLIERNLVPGGTLQADPNLPLERTPYS
ncbi:tRNA (adenosine(37)-N6)-threonylcarbamoyltransferase complex transferase subunit TsaD [bacterium]|nr:tRNA (adenosine(37)-N6)-threonylcarbamoyltransferase complex transferase subunit TsaD [bacterium]